MPPPFPRTPGERVARTLGFVYRRSESIRRRRGVSPGGAAPLKRRLSAVRSFRRSGTVIFSNDRCGPPQPKFPRYINKLQQIG